MQKGHLNSIFWLQRDQSGLEFTLRGAVATENYFGFNEMEPFTIADTAVYDISVEMKEYEDVSKI